MNMRSGHNKQRNRNRHRSGGGGGGGGGGGNPLSRVYESNGPDVKVRGTAQTVADKYMQLGRDAQVSGDNVMAESYYQFAEHYFRIVAAAQAYNQQIQQQYRRPDDDQDDELGDDEAGDDQATVQMRNLPQPSSDPASGQGEQPGDGDERPMPPQQQSRDYRDNRDNRDQRDNRGYRDNRENRDQRDNRDGRDNRDNRDQGGQSYNRDRDRNRSRWQDRRDQPQGQGSNGDNRPSQSPPKCFFFVRAVREAHSDQNQPSIH